MKLLQHFLVVFLLMTTPFLVGAEEDDEHSADIVAQEVQYPEKSMVVIIPSYNNCKWYERNLGSVFSQNYTNFRVIYTDDCSPDGTGELVEKYFIDNDIKHNVSLVRNKARRGPLYNIYSMVHACEDEEIVVTLDGDDWFPDKNVLSRLNAVYSSGDIWMTYGQFQFSSSGERGWAVPMPDDVIRNNTFRLAQLIPTHLRTFYAWLSKRIKLEDLLYMGKPYPMAGDCAIMFALIEMAGERHKFISDIMYVYNNENTLSEHYRSRQLQLHLAQEIQYKKSYKRLAKKPVKINRDKLKADAVIFAQSPAKLVQVLDSIKTYVTGIDHIFVMYKPTSLEESSKYGAIRVLYPETEFDEVDENGAYFGDILFDIYSDIQNNYILFIKGDALFEKATSVNECIKALGDTGAYAFYFKLNAQDADKQLPLIECKNSVVAWNFAVALDQWSFANSFDFVLHKKGQSIASILENYYGSDVRGIEDIWAREGQLNRIGLCFNESHIVPLC